MKPIRLAVIGVGHLGRIHARLAKSLPEIELVAVADPVSESCQAIAAENAVRGVSSHCELAGQIDAAVIATPTRHHHAVAIDLLRQGVHVLVEKPITLCATDAQDLIDAARKSRCVLQVGHVERFNPAYLAGRYEVERPQLIDAVRTAPYSFRSTDVSVVLDLMIHDIDLALAIAQSEVRRVDSVGGKVLGPNEDWAQARITFGSGAVATLFTSRVHASAQRTMHVVGDHGMLWLDFNAKTARLMKPSEEVRRGAINVNRLSADEREQLKTDLSSVHLPVCDLPTTSNNAIQEELREFAQAIRDGSPVSADGRVGRDAVAVAEQVLISIARSHESSPMPAILPFPPKHSPLRKAG